MTCVCPSSNAGVSPKHRQAKTHGCVFTDASS